MGCKQCKQNEQTEGLKLSVKAKKANSDKFIEKSTNLDSIQSTILSVIYLGIYIYIYIWRVSRIYNNIYNILYSYDVKAHITC